MDYILFICLYFVLRILSKAIFLAFHDKNSLDNEGLNFGLGWFGRILIIVLFYLCLTGNYNLDFNSIKWNIFGYWVVSIQVIHFIIAIIINLPYTNVEETSIENETDLRLNILREINYLAMVIALVYTAIKSVDYYHG